jgi:hypothetical protein
MQHKLLLGLGLNTLESDSILTTKAKKQVTQSFKQDSNSLDRND